MQTELIGRIKEKEELLDAYHSGKPEFVALYGRRRVGKTFLIRSLFKNEYAFQMTAVLQTETGLQLRTFSEALVQYGYQDASIAKDWFEAFRRLRVLLENANRKRKVVFIDEMPWLDTKGSHFTAALENFWNGWASGENDILLIVCGSAASWIVQKLLKSRGGLHNRITRRILLEPFTLRECHDYCAQQGLATDSLSLINAYMFIGGIPYYLDLLSNKTSLAQNINRLCFTKAGALRQEFDNLYASLFRNANQHILIVTTLGGKQKGMTRNELVAATGLSDGGGLTNVLDELEISGFIRKYTPFGKKKKGSLYQLVDYFSLFYLAFIRNSPDDDDAYWMKVSETARFKSWRGYAFEQVCLSHSKQIKRALGVSGVITSTSSWRSSETDPGAQIDLVIDRNDGVVTLCEMKYSDAAVSIDKSLADNLKNKRDAFLEEMPTKKAVQLALVTPLGVKRSQYYDTVQAIITGDDLLA
jgi:AAA+ ATPase superfamily predicted ATPase